MKIAADGWQAQRKVGDQLMARVIVRAANGVSDFSVLQNDLRGKSKKLVRTHSIWFISTVTICAKRRWSNGRPPLALIAKSDILFSDSFEIDRAKMFKSACSMGLAGVVSKVSYLLLTTSIAT
jgi:bifunctional non-homologous end joining protein LigD